MELPKKFLENMHIMLDKDFEKFLESYDKESFSGLRVNTLKISVEEFLNIFPFQLTPIKGVENGFYFNKSDSVTKHPYYHAGLFYVQEPSAMIPGTLVKIQDESIVLDLCAAPGGKTTQVATKMNNKGLIVSNDISAGRIKALIKNIEIFGIKNILVVNENHLKLSKATRGIFDKILVDAPCSGEGMFRKNKNLAKDWKYEDIDKYKEIQSDILENIKESLTQGGEIIYSTCTFNRKENEEQIKNFIMNNNEFSQIQLQKDGEYEVNDGFLRVWPHKNKGEGHFAAKIFKSGNITQENKRKKISKTTPPKCFLEFQKEFLNISIEGEFKIIDKRLYLLPYIPFDTSKLRIARSGWFLGEMKGEKFIPSQAFAMGIKMEDFKNTINLDSNSIEVVKYLKGETLTIEGKKGYNIVCVDGYPLGFGIIEKNKLKNKYSSSWRLI
jgi:NOL1/NOP2/sun family putative RNA methylase